MPLRFQFVTKLRLTTVYLYDTVASEKVDNRIPLEVRTCPSISLTASGS